MMKVIKGAGRKLCVEPTLYEITVIIFETHVK